MLDFQVKIQPVLSTMEDKLLRLSISILFLLFITSQALAQFYLGDDTELAARSEIHSKGKRTLPAAGTENAPPAFDITPDELPTMRVGEKIKISFTFYDPDSDPYFAGVIAVTPRVKLEQGRETPRQAARAASVRIEVLPTADNSVVNWEVTAQNPGTAVFFISISEIFTVREGSQVRLVSGKITHREFALRVLNPDEPDVTRPSPFFLDPQPDLRLRLKERTRLVFAADTLEHRPITYGLLYLAYASSLVRALIGPNSVELKAIAPGRGLFVVYVTDGRETAIETFFVDVMRLEDPPDAKPTLRALSASGVAVSSRPIKIQVYGEQLGATAEVVVRADKIERKLQAQRNKNRVMEFQMPADLRGLLSVSVTGLSGEIAFRFHAPLIVEVKRLRNESGDIVGLRLIGYGLGRSALVEADGVELKQNRAEYGEFGDKLVVDLPQQLRSRASLELVITTRTGVRGIPWRVPLI